MVEVKLGIITKTYVEVLNFDELIGKKIVTKNAFTLLMALKNKEE